MNRVAATLADATGTDHEDSSLAGEYATALARLEAGAIEVTANGGTES